MMGIHVEQKSLFSYSVDLEKRIRSDNPLRRIAEVIDFSFVRDEVRELYGQNGHESVDPEIILKLMFLKSSLLEVFSNALKLGWLAARRSM